MTFNSLHFLIFLPAVVILYYILPHKVRWILLLAASYYAYMSWNAWLIFPIMGTTLVSYLSALCMHRAESVKVKRLFLVLTLVVCLGTLVFFKYFNFLIDSVIQLLNLFAMDLSGISLNVILPVGISFYTFQTLSYVIDVYRGKFAPEKHLGYYALYVSYFPQLVAGPIERPENLLPQLKEKHRPDRENLSAGLRIMAVGYFRKCVIADFLGVFVNSVFADIGSANSLAIVAAGALFLLQLYNDFAGYSEIAVGAARIMGIKLMRNFDRPFSATSMRDFIRRWHISLNTWFRDYLYIPLGGSRKGRARQLLNLFIVYALCGLWHGANWTYVLWGIYVAVIMTAEILLRKPYHALREKLGLKSDGGLMMFRQAIVFILCIIGALIFRAQSVEQIVEIFYGLFTGAGFGASYLDASLGALSMNISDLLRIAVVLVCMIKLYDITEYKPNDSGLQPLADCMEGSASRSLYSRRAATMVYAVLAIALGWLILLADDGASAFVYFQF